MEKMRRRTAALFATGLVLAALLVMMTTYSRKSTAGTWGLTPTAYNYLPFVAREPTPTPTPTATPEPTTSPTLKDGYYVADLSENSDYARGEIRFIIDQNGTRAQDAGFLFQAYYSICPWVGYSWYESAPVENGTFKFFEIQDRSVLARLSCRAVSRTEAHCEAYYHNVDVSNCAAAEGIARLQ